MFIQNSRLSKGLAVSLALLSLGIVSSWCVMTLGDLLEHLFSFGKYPFLLFGRVLCHMMGAVQVVVLLCRNHRGFLERKGHMISVR